MEIPTVKVLLVDDEAAHRDKLYDMLLDFGYSAVTAQSGPEALGKYSQHDDIAIVIADYQMGCMDGLELAKALRAEDDKRDLYVIIMTAKQIPDPLKKFPVGIVNDFLTKSWKPEPLMNSLTEAVRFLDERRKGSMAGLQDDFVEQGLIGSGKYLEALRRDLMRIAPTEFPVLIRGETGTGKELVAKAIHAWSRRKGPFVPVNCAAFSREVMSSELFGHVKGAFTGAMETRKGRFELAHGGTLFLDELGEIDLETQVKLLRVLQTAQFERVGGTQTIEVNARVVSATNRPLEGMIEQRKFREDLLHRVNVFEVNLLPLRERREDIALLAKLLAVKAAAQLNQDAKLFDDAALELLANRAWPGNIRELENVVRRAVVLCEGAVIEAGAIARLLPVTTPFASGTTFDEKIDACKRQLITAALEQTGWVKERAARVLGLEPGKLSYQMKQMGISKNGGLLKSPAEEEDPSSD